MNDLNLDPHFEDADAFYKALINAVDERDEEAGIGLLVRLALILANHVADETVLERAIEEAARRSGVADSRERL